MTDITLSDIGSGYNREVINDNFDKLEDVINNEVLHLTGANVTLLQNIDANSSTIINLRDASSAKEPVTLGQMLAVSASLTTVDASAVTMDTIHPVTTNISGQTALRADSYAQLRTLISGGISDGQLISVDDKGLFVMKTGVVSDDKINNIVFTDASNRYASRLDQTKVGITGHEDFVDDTVTDNSAAINDALTKVVYLDINRTQVRCDSTISVPGRTSIGTSVESGGLVFFSNVVGLQLTAPVAKVRDRLTLEMDASVTTRTTSCIEVGTPSTKSNSCHVSATIIDWGDMAAKTGNGIRVVNGNFVIIREVIMQDIGNTGVYIETLGGNTNAGIIEDCYVNACGVDAYFIEDDVADWIGIGANCIDFGRYGIKYQDNARFNKLTGDVEGVGTVGGAAFAQTDGAAYLAGATSITLDTNGVGLFRIGDVIQFKDDSTEYTIGTDIADVSLGGAFTITPALVVPIVATTKQNITFVSVVNDYIAGVYHGYGCYGNNTAMFPVSNSIFADKLAQASNVVRHRAGPNEWEATFGVPQFNDGISVNNFSHAGELLLTQTGERTYEFNLAGTSGPSILRFLESGLDGLISTDSTLEIIPDGRIINPNPNSDDFHVHSKTGIGVGMSLVCNNNQQARISFGDNNNDSAGNIIYNHSDNTMKFFCNDSNAIMFDTSVVSGETRLFVYNADDSSLKRVKSGALGSGPTGSDRMLYI